MPELSSFEIFVSPVITALESLEGSIILGTSLALVKYFSSTNALATSGYTYVSIIERSVLFSIFKFLIVCISSLTVVVSELISV